MERISKLNKQYEDTLANWQTRYSDKQEEIIGIKEQLSMKDVDIQRVELRVEAERAEKERLVR